MLQKYNFVVNHDLVNIQNFSQRGSLAHVLGVSSPQWQFVDDKQTWLHGPVTTAFTIMVKGFPKVRLLFIDACPLIDFVWIKITPSTSGSASGIDSVSLRFGFPNFHVSTSARGHLFILDPVYIESIARFSTANSNSVTSENQYISTFLPFFNMRLDWLCYCIAFIHLYSASHSMSLSEALPTTALILYRS